MTGRKCRAYGTISYKVCRKITLFKTTWTFIQSLFSLSQLAFQSNGFGHVFVFFFPSVNCCYFFFKLKRIICTLLLCNNIGRSPCFTEKKTSIYFTIQLSFQGNFFRCVRARAHLRKSKGTGKRRHIVAVTLLPTQMFPRLPSRATFVADTNFVSETQNVSDFVQKHFVSTTNARARKRHEQQCVRNNVSSFASTLRHKNRAQEGWQCNAEESLE